MTSHLEVIAVVLMAVGVLFLLLRVSEFPVLAAGLDANFRPDVGCGHNTTLLLSPTLSQTLKRGGCLVVATPHNLRICCPSAILVRDGELCSKCLTGHS